jgi:MFS family permease
LYLTNQVRFFYGYIIVAICFLLFMAIIGLASSFGIYFKPIIDELGWSRAVTSAGFSINLMICGISGILVGGLSDKFGPRVVLSFCGILAVAGYFLTSQMQAIWQFYLYFGVLVGIGSNVFVPSMSAVARWFVARRSLMSGITFSGAGFGMLVLPPIINWFLNVFDWRLSLAVLSLFILVISVLAALLLKRDPSEVGQTPFGVNQAQTHHFQSVGKSLPFKSAVLTREFWLFFIAMICYGFCDFSLQVHIAPHVTDLGISSGGAAAILAVMGGATIVGQIGLGSIGDRFGNKRTFIIGLICITLALITVLLAHELWAFLIFAAFLGLAFGNCSTQESSIVAWLFGMASHGIILGAFAFAFTIGAAVGPWLFGYLYDTTGSYQVAFYIAGILSVAAIIVTLFLKQTLAKEADKVKTA